MNSFDKKESRTVWCGNLSEKVTDFVLFDLFNQAGPVESTSRPKDPNGRPKSFAFIVYKHECSVPYALKVFRGTKLYNCTLHLNSRSRVSYIPVLETNNQNNRRHSYPKTASKQTSDQRKMHNGWNLKQIEKYDSSYSRTSSKRPNKSALQFNVSNLPLTQEGLDVHGANTTLHSMMDNIYSPRSAEYYPNSNIQNNYLRYPNQHQIMQGQSSDLGKYMSTSYGSYNARRHSDWDSYNTYPIPTYIRTRHSFPRRN